MPLQKNSKTELPFIFTYRDTVYGNGFLAEVTARGRVLAVIEDDGVWMHGVNPGDLSACGKAPAEAHTEFRRSFSAVLFDIAETSSSFDDLSDAITRWFYQANVPVQTAWNEAVEIVRNTGLAKKGDMPVVPADTPLEIQVVERREQRDFTTSANVLEAEPALAA